MQVLDAQKIIEKLKLESLKIEGGYFRRNYLSPATIPGISHPGQPKYLCSAIYYLLTPDTYSRVHRLPTDEIFHFYLGDPVEMFWFHNDGSASTLVLGHDLLAGQWVQVVVPAYTWQASRLVGGGNYALMGTTMSPAFEESNFESPTDLPGFLKQYPTQFHMSIKSLWQAPAS